MDQVWDLEQALWVATTTGEVADFYAHTLGDDALIVVAGHRLRRCDMIEHFGDQAPPWSSFVISDREMLVETDELIVLTYRICAEGKTLPHPYRAQISSVYRWRAGDWALVLRQHTPDPEVTAADWLPSTFEAG